MIFYFGKALLTTNLLMSKNQKTRRLISVASAVLCAIGSRRLRADGFVPTMIFTLAAEPIGILSTRAEFVRAAIINGNGLIVCAVFDLRRTKRGMKKIKN